MIAHGNKIKLFAGNGSPRLAQQIADELKMPLGKIKVGKFSDGETSVQIDETVRGCDVFLIQSTSTPVNDNLVELLVMIDAMRRASAGRITAVIPYFGYARQDRKARARDPITAKLVADLLTAAGADRVLTMDLHAPQIQGFFDIPVDNLLGAPVLCNYVKDMEFAKQMSSYEAFVQDKDFGWMIGSALRYSLGRDGCSPERTADFIRRYIDQFDETTLFVMKRDIDTALQGGDLPCDVIWRTVSDDLSVQLEVARQARNGK